MMDRKLIRPNGFFYEYELHAPGKWRALARMYRPAAENTVRHLSAYKAAQEHYCSLFMQHIVGHILRNPPTDLTYATDNDDIPATPEQRANHAPDIMVVRRLQHNYHLIDKNTIFRRVAGDVGDAAHADRCVHEAHLTCDESRSVKSTVPADFQLTYSMQAGALSFVAFGAIGEKPDHRGYRTAPVLLAASRDGVNFLAYLADDMSAISGDTGDPSERSAARARLNAIDRQRLQGLLNSQGLVIKS